MCNHSDQSFLSQVHRKVARAEEITENMNIHTHVYMRTYVCMYACTYVRTYVCAHMQAYVHASIHAKVKQDTTQVKHYTFNTSMDATKHREATIIMIYIYQTIIECTNFCSSEKTGPY